MSRTIKDLADSNFEIFYRPRKDNNIADLLSQLRYDEDDRMDSKTRKNWYTNTEWIDLNPYSGGW